MKKHILLLGYGTVGSGVYEHIQADQTLSDRVEVVRIFVKHPESRVGLPHFGCFTKDPDGLFDGIDLMIEAIGGTDPATSLIEQALRRGIPVITANKEVMNAHFETFLSLASLHQTHILYEAAVMAEIPIIKTLHEALKHGRLTEISGIMNGATNFVLSKTMNEGIAFEQALAIAFDNGYLEADPTDDLFGLDAMRKLSILTKMTLTTKIDPKDILRIKVNVISEETRALFNERHWVLKQVAEATKVEEDVRLQVLPVVLKADHPFYGVDDENNIVSWKDDKDVTHALQGKGAGKIPTAKGVISDLKRWLEGIPYQIDIRYDHLKATSSDHLLIRWLIDISWVLFPKAYVNQSIGHLILTHPMSFHELTPYLDRIRFIAKVGFDHA